MCVFRWSVYRSVLSNQDWVFGTWPTVRAIVSRLETLEKRRTKQLYVSFRLPVICHLVYLVIQMFPVSFQLSMKTNLLTESGADFCTDDKTASSSVTAPTTGDILFISNKLQFRTNTLCLYFSGLQAHELS